MAFGQVYATLGRLERDGLVDVVETGSAGGPERSVYALTDAGADRLAEWLARPAEPALGRADEIVGKTVAALRVGRDPRAFLGAQRAAHLRRMRELTTAPRVEPAARLARDHLMAHMDADLRWLELAIDQAGGDPGAGRRDDTEGSRR